MSKALHVIGGLVLPAISIIAAIADFNSDKSSYRPDFKLIPLHRQTYLELREEIDSVLYDRSIAIHASQLAAAADTLGRYGRDVVKMKTDFSRIICDSLFSGRYVPLPGDVANMVLTNGGMTTGFKGYQLYHVEDYLSPQPLYNGMDAIIFSSIGVDGDPYTWRFSGDTLILVEMLLPAGKDQYVQGDKTYKFLKR